MAYEFDARFMEYYLAPQQSDWPMGETHHGVFFACGFKALRWLKTYVQTYPNAVASVFVIKAH